MQIPEDQDLSAGIALGSTKPSLHTLIREYVALLACADNPTPSGRAGLFVSVGGGGTGKVQVEFEMICRRLRQRILEAVARERYGDDAVRIIRVLLTLDKTDEKHVSGSVLAFPPFLTVCSLPRSPCYPTRTCGPYYPLYLPTL